MIRLSSAFGRGCQPRESGVAAGVRFIAGKTNAYGREKYVRGGKIRAAGEAAGRAEDTSGKRAAYFYRQIRRQIYAARAYENRAEREKKEPCARQGRKGRKEVLRTDKNGRGKSKPRARGKRVYGRERRIAEKQVKMNCFCGFFIQKRQIKAKKMRKTG